MDKETDIEKAEKAPLLEEADKSDLLTSGPALIDQPVVQTPEATNQEQQTVSLMPQIIIPKVFNKYILDKIPNKHRVPF